MRVGQKTLLLIAGLVWFAAGVNILRIGVMAYISYVTGNTIGKILLISVLALAIFAAFSMMFRNIVKKHEKRICAYETKMPFYYFFDKKSYLLMVFMMGLGIFLRRSGLLPEMFFGFFYTGLGTALSVAGIKYFISFAKFGK